DLAEEAKRVVVLAVAVLVPTEQVVELPVQLALVRVVELVDRAVVVLADALDDVRRLRKVRRELREPEERLVELEVIRLVGDLGEDAVCALIELEAVERDREVVLRELLVAFVVAGLALVDAVEGQRRIAPLFAVEEALGLRGLLAHLTRDGRRARCGRRSATCGRCGGLIELDRLGAATSRRLGRWLFLRAARR